MSASWEQVTVIVLALTVLGAVYITPGVIAFKRRHPQRWSILIVSLAFGGTLIGWVAALIWAIQPLDDPTDGWPQATEEAAAASLTLSSELERLHQLRQQGVISDDEYSALKAKLIG